MSQDFDTADKVYAWALDCEVPGKTYNAPDAQAGYEERFAETLMAAEYLAECVRLRQAFERNPGASTDELYRVLEGQPMSIPVMPVKLTEDMPIRVCASCLTAACWLGELMCQESRTADIRELPVRELRKLGREHQSHWANEVASRVGMRGALVGS